MASFQEQGGRVAEDTFYVEREADRTLFERLRDGQMCVVLAPRQIGKSSLRARTEQRLTESGITAVSVDITPYAGAEITEHHFYGGIIRDIVRQLGWERSRILTEMAELPPSEWWNEFVRRELPERATGPTVIFLDEVEHVRKCEAFEPDAFFTSIRLAINRPPITFCLLGTLTPWEFLRDAPPFNVGVQIRLEDFTREEARTFLPGLQPLGDPEPLLDEVLQWTSGHPHLTQRVCAALIRAGHRNVTEIVHKELTRLHGDALFVYAEKHFDDYARGPTGSELVVLYGKVLGNERIAPNANSREQRELRVTGMVAERDVDGARVLAVRNKIYAQHFNQEWLKPRRMNRFFSAAVTHWRESGRSKGFLNGGDLEDAIRWAVSEKSVTGEELEFLLASKQMEQKEAVVVVEKAAEKERRHRDRLSIRVYLIGIAVWLVFAGAAVYFRQQAVQTETALGTERGTIQQLTGNIESLRATQKKETDALNVQILRLQTMNEEREKAIVKFEANLATLDRTRRALEEVKSLDQSKYQRQISDLDQQLKITASAVEKAQVEYKALKEAVSAAEKDAISAKASSVAAARRAEDASAAAKQAEQDRSSLEQQLQQAKEARSLVETRAQTSEDARAKAEQALLAVQTLTDTTQKQLLAAQTQLTAAQAQQSQLEKDLKTVCAKLAAPLKPPCP